MSRRWINTLVLHDAQGNVIKREGYWYDGPLSLVAAADFDLSDYAFYDDDANEATSTQIGSTNAQTTLDVDVDLQARVNITESIGGTGQLGKIKWRYNLNGAGVVNVGTSSSVVQAVDSANHTDEEDASDRIGSGGTYITTNLGVTENGDTPNLAYAASERSNFVLLFKIIGADVSDGDEIILSIQGVDTTTNIPDIDVNKPSGAPRRIFVVS
ncbi:hypothetical protein LCGC14_2509010 [marine sediment metagenome]|uniref:Uncharacterized protein n=1 Tax=marine sediment metagenome TaxID=412755 RepID=A0A0F9DT74_9ZZZZ